MNIVHHHTSNRLKCSSVPCVPKRVCGTLVIDTCCCRRCCPWPPYTLDIVHLHLRDTWHFYHHHFDHLNHHLDHLDHIHLHLHLSHCIDLSPLAVWHLSPVLLLDHLNHPTLNSWPPAPDMNISASWITPLSMHTKFSRPHYELQNAWR